MSMLQSTRDVVIRTESWRAATEFYGSALGLPEVYRSDTLVGFETGAFRLYVGQGAAHGPVFEFLVVDVGASRDRLLAAGGTLREEDASVPRRYLADPYGLVFNLGRSRPAPP